MARQLYAYQNFTAGERALAGPSWCRHLIYGVLGWNDPAPRAERPRTWGGTTAFGADVGRIDPGRIDRYPNTALVSKLSAQ